MSNPMTAKEALDNIKNTETTDWSDSGTSYAMNIFEKDDENIACLEQLVSKFGSIPPSITIEELKEKMGKDIVERFYARPQRRYVENTHTNTTVIIEKNKIVSVQTNYPIIDKWLYAMWLNETEIITQKEKTK